MWDINDMICIRNYSAAHSMIVNAIAVKPKSAHSFATGSMDQYVTLWDENTDKAVLGEKSWFYFIYWFTKIVFSSNFRFHVKDTYFSAIIT